MIVLLHGLAMNYTLWRDVIAELRMDHRCVAPTLPVGAHRHPVRDSFELTPMRVADLIGEVIDALGLYEVTLVENDSGRAQDFTAAYPHRIAKLALVACEAFDNYPPGLPGKLVGQLMRLPGTVWLLAQIARSPLMLQSPLLFGLMTKRGIPADILASWVAPMIESRRIRQDFQSYCRASLKHDMAASSFGLAAFGGPALIVWAENDRVMPASHGPRLAGVLPAARLVEFASCATLVPIDQPRRLAAELRSFVAG